MQIKTIALAVHHACRIIGEEWRQKQHIAEVNRKFAEAKKQTT